MSIERLVHERNHFYAMIFRWPMNAVSSLASTESSSRSTVDLDKFSIL